ncbi:MAG: hypothetical protein MUF25_25975 [Pirellulaceae bacterium]|jgi:hypothetical protein|nr:hypothetical protein [Pirellulaceae bacterium]
MANTIRIYDMVADEIGRLLAEDGINLTADELVALTEFIEELEGDANGCETLELLRPRQAAA